MTLLNEIRRKVDTSEYKNGKNTPKLRVNT